MRAGTVTVELTRSEYEMIRRGLGMAWMVYAGHRRRLPRTSKWKPVERAVAAAECSMLMEEKFPKVEDGAPWPPPKEAKTNG